MEFPPDPLSPRPSYARIAMRRGETRRDLKTEGGEQPDRQTSDAGSEVDIRVCSSAESRLSAVFCPPASSRSVLDVCGKRSFPANSQSFCRRQNVP